MTALPPIATRRTRVKPMLDPAGVTSCACGTSDHFVQFYERDESLVTSVRQYAQDALCQGASILLIATEKHLDAIAEKLEEAGVELDDLAAEGRYVPMHAEHVLRQIMEDGLVQPALFARHIESHVTKLTADGRELWAFGEMVALLWANGNGAAALQLEALWNALAARQVMRLFCAYPIRDFASHAATGRFADLCKAHDRVLPTEAFIESGRTHEEQLRTIAVLQQKAAALGTELVQRKQAEAALRAREAQLTSLVETTSFALQWLGQKGEILWANRAELDLLGYPVNEFVGRNVADFHVDPDVVAELLSCLESGRDMRNREARLRCKDGTIKTVVIDLTGFWHDGRLVHSQCFTRDVTSQRKGEQAFRYLAAIVEGSDDAIVGKNLDGTVTSWNRAAERIFGYTAGEMIGRSITQLIPPERLTEETHILAQLRRGNRVDHFETIRRCKDGTLLDVSLTISPIRDSSGAIIGASKIARDITQQKNAEAALNSARDELARTNAELEQRVEERTASLREAIAQLEEFSYTVSHDLRAPLRGMQVYSEALLEDYGPTLDREARHCLGRIAENASRLDKMVIDVLTFSRISRADLRMEDIDLDRLVRDLLQNYPSLQSPRANIDVAKLHAVRGHDPSLIQVLSNLLSNAVKFVPAGITPTIRIWTEENANGVRLFVRDNGIGIKPEWQARLFQMFERLHSSLPYEGTGVGLAIVRKAAQRMGGEVGVISDGENGSTFWVQLPAAGSSS